MYFFIRRDTSPAGSRAHVPVLVRAYRRRTRLVEHWFPAAPAARRRPRKAARVHQTVAVERRSFSTGRPVVPGSEYNT
eukprot:COSAG02_NODE_2156_length_9643_cov_55.052761_5_plen_78_part_00